MSSLSRPLVPEISPPQLSSESANYRKASLALFLAGFSTFSLLYCVQPLLPAFSGTFHLNPATSALALSTSTGALALSIFIMGALSECFDRRNLMFVSMLSAAGFNIASGLVPSWPLLLICRTFEGLVLGGVPAVAMVYLVEEIDPRHLGKAMGQYIGGTAFGAMAGRIGMGMLNDLYPWHIAMIVMGATGLIAAIGFRALLPASMHFQPRSAASFKTHIGHWSALLQQPALLLLFGIGFILTSIFVGLFNYVGFRLAQPPYALTPAAISLIFLTYAGGIFASPLGGRLAGRFGRRLVLMFGLGLMGLGALITLDTHLPVIIAGVLLVTLGFFIAHAIASTWVGQLSGRRRSYGSSLYLLSYYAGASISGIVGGIAWQVGDWIAVVALVEALAICALISAYTLGRQAHGQ